MKIIPHNKIDKLLWNNLLDDSLAKVYQYSWYLDIVAPKWKMLCSDDGAYLLPIPIRKKLMLPYVFAPNFVQAFTLLKNNNNSVRLEEVIEFLKKQFIHIDMHFYSDLPIEGLSKRVNFELSLDASFEELSNNFNNNTKRNIKKFEKSGLGDFENCPENYSDVIQLFKEDKSRQLKLPKDFFTKAENLFASCLENNVLDTWQLKYKGQNLCGAICLKHRNRIIFIFSGNSQPARKCGGLHALMSHLIKYYQKDYTIFDFEGSDKNGLAQFYQSFGAKENLYLRLRKTSIKN